MRSAVDPDQASCEAGQRALSNLDLSLCGIHEINVKRARLAMLALSAATFVHRPTIHQGRHTCTSLAGWVHGAVLLYMTKSSSRYGVSSRAGAQGASFLLQHFLWMVSEVEIPACMYAFIVRRISVRARSLPWSSDLLRTCRAIDRTKSGMPLANR